MNTLYKYFPKQVAIPYRLLARNKEEFYALVNKHNGKRRVFASLYNYTGSENSSLLIDKIWFDLDSPQSFENIKKMHDWAKTNDYMHIVAFSGGGFHLYMMCENFRALKNPKGALKEAQLAILSELHLKAGRPELADIDEHIIGDVARVVTVINTYNVKRRKYCISLSDDDLAAGLDHIREKANEQQFSLNWFGSKRFDISKYDTSTFGSSINELGLDVKERIDSDVSLAKFPPCIASKFIGEYVGFRERFHIYCWLRDAGYTETQVTNLAKKYWSHIDGGPTAANLADYIIRNRQIHKVFEKDSIMAANCETLRNEGFCVKKICKWKNKLYL
jgi:hypothetical protein